MPFALVANLASVSLVIAGLSNASESDEMGCAPFRRWGADLPFLQAGFRRAREENLACFEVRSELV